MLDCRQATELMSRQMDGGLALGQRLSLKMHLMMCGGCRNFGKQVHFLREALRRLPHEEK